ncbi:MAG: acyl-CoA dehydrogenase family protein [Spirochaetes bacterium]|nr:acyl-CoA dehydrogenase family protein [Spirochaetota bacterium]
MDNFFTDNQDIQLIFENTDLTEVIDLKEGDYAEADEYDFAFTDAQDAKEGCREVLTLIGEIAAQIIAPLAPEVDEEGAHFDHGTVTYAKGTQHAMDVLKNSNLMGFTLPRKYGGLNMPTFIYTIAVEMVSQADASLMNLFGLQDIGDTICEFGDEEQKMRYLPQFSSGEATGAMALTEPDAGSDLQAVQLKATYDESDGTWRLNGVKRFITNGCGDILLVLARSESGTKDGRGLSMFIVEKDESLVVRRIEDKLGIHGSPTCELQFNNTLGHLVGKRRMGLIRYVMALMNGARLGIAAQGLGIAQAAYLEGLEYARAREQFGKAIIDMPLVYEMLISARVNIEAARMLTYDSSRIVDLKKSYDHLLEKSEKPDRELRAQAKYYTSLAALLTPMAKYFSTELANKTAYDMLQIHGGTGYMRDFNIERHYRDARITNIYEGTTQLQYVAAIGGVVTRVWEPEFDRLETQLNDEWQKPLAKELKKKRELLSKAVDYIREKNDHDYQSYYQDKLVEMATKLYIGYLFVKYGVFSDEKKKTAAIFFEKEMPIIEEHYQVVTSGKTRVIEEYADLLKAED